MGAAFDILDITGPSFGAILGVISRGVMQAECLFPSGNPAQEALVATIAVG